MQRDAGVPAVAVYVVEAVVILVVLLADAWCPARGRRLRAARMTDAVALWRISRRGGAGGDTAPPRRDR